jgi:hypothetical protein
MSADLAAEYVLEGKSVDILLNGSDTDAAHERRVVGLADGLLVCVAPDGVTEWYPLTSILSIVDRANPRNIQRTKSYYGVS